MDRNLKLYNDNENDKLSDQILNDKIIHLYTLQHDVGAHDKDIFLTPIEERFKLKEYQKKYGLKKLQ